jgi:hypothetical protein
VFVGSAKTEECNHDLILINSMKDLHQELMDDGFISQSHFEQIDAINSKKIVSLNFELRLVLYLGIMLFSGGVGYLVYLNMGSIGHLAIMFLLFSAICVGTYFISIKSSPYSNGVSEKAVIYFDYLVVLVSLLLISLFTYFQVYFDLVAMLLRWTSLFSALVFLFLAYRFDNKMVLSLGVTALAAVFGLTVSPVDWVNGNWLEGKELYLLGLGYGSMLLLVSQGLEYKKIKVHFTFTYQHFGWLLFYFGALALSFDYHNELYIAVIVLLISLSIMRYQWQQKSFLFFIYSSLAGYVLFTFLIFSSGIAEGDLFALGMFYFPISFIGTIVLLVKNRKHFSNDE